MNDRLAVATRKGLFFVDRAAGRWRVVRDAFVGDNVSMFLHDPRDGAIYAALDHGHFGPKLQRSSDGGEQWEEMAPPAFPQQPEGEQDLDPMRGTPVPWAVQRIWALEAGHIDHPGELWCGTIPGGLFHSTNGGSSWELVRPLWDHPRRKDWFGGGADFPGIHSIAVHPADPRHLTVGVSCGGVWISPDAGGSWACKAEGMRAAYMPPEREYDPHIQDPHLVVRCQARPDTLWAQHHNGIFRSTDGAARWTEIRCENPSSFGFAVAVHPREPDTAWFVPGVSDQKRVPVSSQVVVTRTRDGGGSFEVLRRGLPQDYAYDITYRHCLAIDQSGDRLAFGTTTGALYVSENQGDSWTEVTAHLPPVYAVRFG